MQSKKRACIHVQCMYYLSFTFAVVFLHQAIIILVLLQSYPKMAVAGAPGGPVHVFSREAEPGMALLCQARRLHQHPPKARLTEILPAHAKPPFLCPPQKRPSPPPRQALQAAGSAPQRRLWIFNVGVASLSHPPPRLFPPRRAPSLPVACS